MKITVDTDHRPLIILTTSKTDGGMAESVFYAEDVSFIHFETFPSSGDDFIDGEETAELMIEFHHPTRQVAVKLRAHFPDRGDALREVLRSVTKAWRMAIDNKKAGAEPLLLG